jgi:hypothetical protein
MRIRSLAVIVYLLGSALWCASADAQSWVGGASVGSARQHDYEVGGPISHRDESATAYRIFGGYTFAKHYAAVLSYVDFGEPEYSGPAFGGFTDRLKASAIDMSLIAGFAPGEQKLVNVFGMVGLFRFSQDVHYVDPGEIYDGTDTGVRFSYGTGVQLNLGPVWAMHVAFQRFPRVGDKNNSGHEYTRDLIDLGFDYRFGL